MRRTTHAGYTTYPGYRFLRFIDAPADPDNPAPAGGAPATPAAPAGQAPKADDDQDRGKGDGLPDDPEALKAEIAKLRKEAADRRVGNKGPEGVKNAAEAATQDVIGKIAAALGITKTEEVTVESLQEQLTAEKAEATKAQEAAQAAALQLAIYKAAGAAKADADLLLDSARFQATLKDIDLTDSAAVTDAIKAWVKDNPKFAATQVVGASTIEHPGGTGEGPKHSTSLEQAVAKKLAQS